MPAVAMAPMRQDEAGDGVRDLCLDADIAVPVEGMAGAADGQSTAGKGDELQVARARLSLLSGIPSRHAAGHSC